MGGRVRGGRLGGLATAALFVGVFPGNVHMAQRANTPKRRLATVLRLPLQVPLLWWAWRVVRDSEARPATGHGAGVE